MITRSASLADLAAITELHRRWDVAHFGAPEHDESEVREEFERVRSPAEDSRLVFDRDRLLAAAWRWSAEATLLVDPAVERGPLYDDLVGWLEEREVRAVEVLSSDERTRGAVIDRNWSYTRSTFELLRHCGPDWTIPAPAWPAAIRVRGYRPEDAAAVHRLIYVDAGWADVPGHHERDLAEWSAIFVTDAALPEHQVLAWRDDRLVGVALGRTYSGDVGWISQLAVARDERRHGLGRALLLESLRRYRSGGATSLGLGVQASNRSALRLYLDVGLRIDREWQVFEPPDVD
jgi:ribosomal protein S18 acetylase RimI-like enzyme